MPVVVDPELSVKPLLKPDVLINAMMLNRQTNTKITDAPLVIGIGGRFYRPVKQAVSMRLDADVVAWLKKRGKGYQTRANRILRQHMLADSKRA